MASLTFKEKVESGQFDTKIMNAMVIQFENQIYDNQVKADNKPELRAKIKVIKDYLHKLCSTPASPKTDDTLGNKTHTTSSKTIILNTGKKKSAKGLLKVTKDEQGNFILHDQVCWEEEAQGELKTVFLDGVLTSETSLSEIRDRLWN